MTQPTAQSIDLRVNGDRLIAEVGALARIGATSRRRCVATRVQR